MERYFVKKTDVGKTDMTPVTEVCEHCGSTVREYPFEPLGRVIVQDVGKMCKKVNGLWYVESDEQFKKRIERVNNDKRI